METLNAIMARRIPLEQPPSEAEERKVERFQAAVRRRIGARVNGLRTEAGLSLRAMATRVNVAPTYLSEIERGLRSPTTDLLVRISYRMGIGPDFFFSDK